MAKFKAGNEWFSQNTQILSDSLTLSITDKQQQFLDPNGQDRVINMPAEATSAGLPFWIINIGTSNDLIVKNNSGTITLITIKSGEIGYLTNDGNGWISTVGSTGASGSIGDTGGTGATGSVGATGGTGATGDTGSQGPQGQTGGTGAQGPQGIQGTAGDTGGTGAQGLQGIQGTAGDTGATGAPGGTGGTGTRGEGFNIDESISSFTITDVTRIQGIGTISTSDVYIVTIYSDNREDKNTPSGISGDMTHHIVMYDGTSWYDWGLFIGDTGATGAPGGTGGTGGIGGTGDVGPTLTGGTGAPGTAGATGGTGAQGPEGIQGTAGATGGTGAQGTQGSVGSTGGTGGIGIQGTVGATGGTGATGSQGSVTGVKTGQLELSSGIINITVTFAEAYSDVNYSIGYSVVNIIDSNPSSYGMVVSSKTASGFIITLSGFTDSSNYVLNWLTIHS